MKIFSSDYVLIEGELKKKVYLVTNENGIIEDILINPDYEISEIKYVEGILCPGFVNTHCHLELSMLRGAIDPGKGMAHFVSKVVFLRNNYSKDEIDQAIETAIQEAIETGTVAIGDISNDTSTFEIKRKYMDTMYFLTFWEVFGLDPKKNLDKIDSFEKVKLQYQDLPIVLTPHAPYSVNQSLLSEISKRHTNLTAPLSIHFLESIDEILLFKEKKGGLIQFFKSLNISFENNYESPLDYIAETISTDIKLLFIHFTMGNIGDLREIKKVFPKSLLCLCPKSNIYIHGQISPSFEEYRLPEIASFGTDSLASNNSLNILNELIVFQKTYPNISTSNLLTSATKTGAKALGIEDQFGEFRIKTKPGITAITGLDSSLKFQDHSKSYKII